MWIPGSRITRSGMAQPALLDRARSGGGPTLVEAKCYRFLSHTTDDDDRTYRPREDVERERGNDPLPRFETRLIELRTAASGTPLFLLPPAAGSL